MADVAGANDLVHFPGDLGGNSCQVELTGPLDCLLAFVIVFLLLHWVMIWIPSVVVLDLCCVSRLWSSLSLRVSPCDVSMCVLFDLFFLRYSIGFCNTFERLAAKSARRGGGK